jgi:hypothetical protein
MDPLETLRRHPVIWFKLHKLNTGAGLGYW